MIHTHEFHQIKSSSWPIWLHVSISYTYKILDTFRCTCIKSHTYPTHHSLSKDAYHYSDFPSTINQFHCLHGNLMLHSYPIHLSQHLIDACDCLLPLGLGENESSNFSLCYMSTTRCAIKSYLCSLSFAKENKPILKVAQKFKPCS